MSLLFQDRATFSLVQDIDTLRRCPDDKKQQQQQQQQQQTCYGVNREIRYKSVILTYIKFGQCYNARIQWIGAGQYVINSLSDVLTPWSRWGYNKPHKYRR